MFCICTQMDIGHISSMNFTPAKEKNVLNEKHIDEEDNSVKIL